MDKTADKPFMIQLQRRNDVHLLRKFWHVGMGVTGLSLYYHFDVITVDVVMMVLFPLALCGYLLDQLRIRVPAVNKIVLKIMGPFMRTHEANSVTGLPFYALGVAGSLFLFEEKLAVLSIFFLVFADPISSYFGICYGRDKIMPGKSLQGAVAGFVVCYIITVLYGIQFAGPSLSLILFAILAGFIGSISELMSVFCDDNLTIPIISGAGLTLLNAFFQIF